MNTRQHLIAAVATLLVAGTAAACETNFTAAPTGPSLSRAEVKADLALWQRAGLDKLTVEAQYDVQSPAYQQAQAAYQALRNGPAFAAEVQRQGGAVTAGVTALPPAQTMSISRAEVQADLNLWRRAGMAEVQALGEWDAGAPAYQQALATYQSLRNGPAFLAEVQRLRGERNVASTGNSNGNAN